MTHPVVTRTELDGATGETAGLVGAALVNVSSHLPGTELELTFTDGTRTWKVTLQPTKVRNV